MRLTSISLTPRIERSGRSIWHWSRKVWKVRGMSREGTEGNLDGLKRCEEYMLFFWVCTNSHLIIIISISILYSESFLYILIYFINSLSSILSINLFTSNLIHLITNGTSPSLKHNQRPFLISVSRTPHESHVQSSKPPPSQTPSHQTL